MLQTYGGMLCINVQKGKNTTVKTKEKKAKKNMVISYHHPLLGWVSDHNTVL
jgi:hypothetical protein